MRGNNAKVQLWVLCVHRHGRAGGVCLSSSLGVDFRLGFLLGVLFFELAIGSVVYRVALDSAVEHGMHDRERIIDALSKTSSPVGGSLGIS